MSTSATHSADTDTLQYLWEPELDPLFWPDGRAGVASAWYGHVPFAHWIVGIAKPRVLLELGTHNGVSYSAFCEAVLRNRLELVVMQSIPGGATFKPDIMARKFLPNCAGSMTTTMELFPSLFAAPLTKRFLISASPRWTCCTLTVCTLTRLYDRTSKAGSRSYPKAQLSCFTIRM